MSGNVNEGNAAFIETANRLRAWVERLVRIEIEMRVCRCELADLGVIGNGRPLIRSTDTPGVVRAKECLAALIAKQKKIMTEMSRVGARLVDDKLWEVLIPGGPEEGSFLSWTLGEGAIGYYRETDNLSSMRQRLPGVDPRIVDPVRH